MNNTVKPMFNIDSSDFSLEDQRILKVQNDLVDELHSYILNCEYVLNEFKDELNPFNKFEPNEKILAKLENQLKND